jgi:hypothetical protein
MSKRATGFVVGLWLLLLLAVAGLVQAQSYRINPVTPSVIAGPNFGIRIEGTENGVPIGVPVVQIGGKWVPVKFGAVDGQTKLLR